MTDATKPDLLELAVRAGSLEKPNGVASKGDIFEDIYQALYPTKEEKQSSQWGFDLREVLFGSLRCAQSLHESVLPNYGWIATVAVVAHGMAARGKKDDLLSRHILAFILRAKAGMK